VGETVASAEPGSAEMANSDVSGDAGSGGQNASGEPSSKGGACPCFRPATYQGEYPR
jgi:hypothetical protein